MPSAPLSLALCRVRRRAWAAALIDTTSAAVVAAAVTGGTVFWAGWPPAVPSAAAAVAAAFMAWRAPPSMAQAAGKLDQQFNLHDLLASAWGVRDRLDQPWAATLWSIANAKAAALPPASWAGRFSPRQHACGLALAAALLLATQLIAPAATDTAAAQPLASTASPLVTQVLTIADVHQRHGDTATGETHPIDTASAELPSTAGRSDQPTSPAADAQGNGRADADRTTPLRSVSAVSSPLPARTGKSGSGRARAVFNAAEVARGEVAPVRSVASADAVNSNPSAHPTDAHHSTAIAIPSNYRELINDYFAR